MNIENARIVKTGLFTDEAEEILDSVIGQWADGIWENSTSKEKYWKFASVKRAANGEVLIYIDNQSSLLEKWGNQSHWTFNAFHGQSDAVVLDIFGKTVRRIVQIEFSDDKGKVQPNSWIKNSTQELTYMGGHCCNVTVGHAYQVWSILTGHSNGKLVDEKFDVVGKPKSDEETEAAAKKIEAYKHERALYEAAIKKLEEDHKANVAALEKAKSENRLKLWDDLMKKAELLGVDLRCI